MIETTVKVINNAGLHTRPAASVVKTASRFKSEIFLIRDSYLINAKSIIGVMTLAAENGCSLILQTEGDDEKEAADAIIHLFTTGFGEV